MKIFAQISKFQRELGHSASQSVPVVLWQIGVPFYVRGQAELH